MEECWQLVRAAEAVMMGSKESQQDCGLRDVKKKKLKVRNAIENENQEVE